ncbi:MAG: hypothetical protein WC773_02170 [Patescibacteria group bacterium]
MIELDKREGDTTMPRARKHRTRAEVHEAIMAKLREMPPEEAERVLERLTAEPYPQPGPKPWITREDVDAVIERIRQMTPEQLAEKLFREPV